MKRNVLIFAFLVSFCFTAVAQTKVNSGKTFVVYSYDNWEMASSDYLKLSEEYSFITFYLRDDSDFDNQNYFTVKPGEWNYFIVRRVDSDGKGIRGSLYISSPEGRQTELIGYTVSFSMFGNDKEKCQEYLNDMELRYKFLGEPIP